MRWAALYRRTPILRRVSASQIRADNAADQEQLNARYGPAPPSSPQLLPVNQASACAFADAALLASPLRSRHNKLRVTRLISSTLLGLLNSYPTMVLATLCPGRRCASVL